MVICVVAVARVLELDVAVTGPPGVCAGDR